MRHSLIIVDDFLENPQEILEMALNQEFLDHEWRGAVYDGLSPSSRFDPTREISQAMRFPVKIDISFFRLALSGQRPGSIHTDSVESTWAGVLYLSDPEKELAGTAFWSHKDYGWDRLPPAEYLVDNGINPDSEFKEKIASEGYVENLWDLNSVVGARYNRFVAYPTEFFHSRYPRFSMATDKFDGRLTWSCFFREEGAEKVKEAQ